MCVALFNTLKYLLYAFIFSDNGNFSSSEGFLVIFLLTSLGVFKVGGAVTIVCSFSHFVMSLCVVSLQ